MGGGSLFRTAEGGGSRLMQALVVDDSVIYRKLIGDHLRGWGFDVTPAETGSEAWEILQQPDAPKLVLLDWRCPISMALSFCQRIPDHRAPTSTSSC
jgi:CheY-like chemotaxis protein